LYIGISELKIPEENFWAMTPRKFYSLVHCWQKYKNKSGGAGDDEQENKLAFIDQIPGF